MRISHKYKFVFLANPRCGSESIRAMLDPYTDIKGRVNRGNLGMHDSAKLVQAAFLDREWRWRDYYSFTTIRNPWARVVSAYYYGRKNPRSAFAYSVGLEFLPFVKDQQTIFVSKQYRIKAFAMDEDENLIVNDVFRIEDIDQWWPRLAEKLRLPDPSVIHINKTEHGSYRNYFDEETQQSVAQLWAKDIELGGYTF